MSNLPVALQSAMRNPVKLPENGMYYTPVFRAAFVHLDEPWAGQDAAPGTPPAFSLLAVFSDDADLSSLVLPLNNLLTSRFGPQALDLVKVGSLKYPLRAKMIMAQKYTGFEGNGVFASLRARQDAPPAVIHFPKPNEHQILQRGAIERFVYAGCYCYAAVSMYNYDKGGGKGVSIGLRTLVKVADGERFGGPSAPTEGEALQAITNVSLPPELLALPGGTPTIEGKATEVAASPGPAMPWDLPKGKPMDLGEQALLDALA